MDRADVVIVGGGAMGAATAYFLKAELAFPGSVLVIERDPSFATASTTLSAASIRTQFSTPENIRMSQFGFAFLRDVKARFGDDAEVGLHEGGYLILVSDERLPALRQAHAAQIAEGADVALLAPQPLAARFSWLATDGLAAGSLGLSGEGWFDAHAMLHLLRRAAGEAGAAHLTGEVVAVERTAARISAVRLASGAGIACGALVNAAGPAAGKLARLAGIDLPVEARKRSVFVVHAPDAPSTMPLLVDISGAYLRPEGAFHICGISPPEEMDGPAEDFEPDWPLFEDHVWPALAARVPGFERLKLMRAWAGHYEMNLLDYNAVIGAHPEVANFYFLNGFSGHGVQHAPAAGRGLAELIAHGAYRSLDLSAFVYDRILHARPLREAAVI